MEKLIIANLHCRQSWSRIWEEDRGPCWVSEAPAALLKLDAWRASVIARDQSSKPTQSLTDHLCNNQSIFSGFGAHTAADFLFQLSIHPAAPAWVVCDHDNQYAEFRSHMVNFMAQWISEEFLRHCACSTNSENPLAFNYRAHRMYMSRYVNVHNLSAVNIPFPQYIVMLLNGMLDGEHILGEWYIYCSGCVFRSNLCFEPQVKHIGNLWWYLRQRNSSAAQSCTSKHQKRIQDFSPQSMRAVLLLGALNMSFLILWFDYFASSFHLCAQGFSRKLLRIHKPMDIAPHSELQTFVSSRTTSST